MIIRLIKCNGCVAASSRLQSYNSYRAPVILFPFYLLNSLPLLLSLSPPVLSHFRATHFPRTFGKLCLSQRIAYDGNRPHFFLHRYSGKMVEALI